MDCEVALFGLELSTRTRPIAVVVSGDGGRRSEVEAEAETLREKTIR